MKKIGFIGVGIMGKSMVRNLMKAGYELHIFARRLEKVEDVVKEGAIFHTNIESCVAHVDAVITIVGFPQDVEEVYFDPKNILQSAKAGCYLIDMTTTSPQLSQKIYKEGKAAGYRVLDAPVSGGEMGAKNATMTIFVGGDQQDYKACLPLFEAMGSNINYFGAAGNGQHCKLANQIMLGGALEGVCEAFSYAKEKGLDLELVQKAVASGSAGSTQLNMQGAKIIADDYSPGFYLKHFVKDLKLALVEANISGLSLEMLSQLTAIYEELETDGYGDEGTQALIRYYEKGEDINEDEDIVEVQE